MLSALDWMSPENRALIDWSGSFRVATRKVIHTFADYARLVGQGFSNRRESRHVRHSDE
jgi:hypothetical protein